MRLFEFTEDFPALPNLLTVLNHYINRANEEGSEAKVETAALINAVKNTGVHFDYNTLVLANEELAVQELVRSISKEEVVLNTGDATTDMTSNDGPEPEDKVGDMAKSAIDI